MRAQVLRCLTGVSAAIMVCAISTGCQKAKPVATAADIAAAQADAQTEIQEAHVEAKKDVKNAAKRAGSDSKDVALARVTGAFDIAMANADGAHKVALEQCMTLPPAQQQPCKDRADADYQAAAAKGSFTCNLQTAPSVTVSSGSFTSGVGISRSGGHLCSRRCVGSQQKRRAQSPSSGSARQQRRY